MMADQSRTINPMVITRNGKAFCGDSAELMKKLFKRSSIDLIITSPPYGLVRKKAYGNKDAKDYNSWFKQFAHEFHRILKPTGSLVIDIGGAWKKGKPTRSLYHYELLIMLCKEFGFELAQEFFWWNPAKLPAPAEWVTVRRIRVKDAVNCIWWLSKTPYPKASNLRVLNPYSESMLDLLENGYEPKLRPSGHNISENFSRENVGAIPPNLIALANTESNSEYQRYCRENSLPIHPARFPEGIPAFFIRMLTERGDLILDPFAGSCVSGSVAEAMDRRWVCIEIEKKYLEGAKGRFQENAERQMELPGTLSYSPINRNKPYEINPPNFGLHDEESTPLPKDGGKKRRNQKNKEPKN